MIIVTCTGGSVKRFGRVNSDVHNSFIFVKTALHGRVFLRDRFALTIPAVYAIMPSVVRGCYKEAYTVWLKTEW